MKFGDVEVKPGETRVINLTVARLYDFTEMKIPIKVIRSREEGPILFISAAIHGDEINGVEVVRRLLNQKSLRHIKGTLIAVPIVNVFGFNTRSRYLPDRRDLNRCFPGSANGSLAARLAYIFMKEIVEKCTHGIDLHTGAIHRKNLPQVRAELDDAETNRLAHAFGVPVVLKSSLRDGSLRQAAADLKIPILLYEGGEALRFDENVIQVGVRGVMSVMKAIGMLPASSSLPQYPQKKQESFVACNSYWVRAPQSGVLKKIKKLGSMVKEGDVLATISGPFGEHRQEVKVPHEGLIIGSSMLPLVNRGDAVYHVASFDDYDAVRETVEMYGEDFVDVLRQIF